MKTVAVYTSAPWAHALAVLRLSGPLLHAGFRLVYGSQEGKIDTEMVPSADLVLIQRDFPKHLAAYERILFLARKSSIPVILDLDDWLLELPENHPDRISHHYAEGLFPILRAILESDAVTVTTERLRDQVLQLNDSVCVLPNYIDEKMWMLTPPAPANEGPIKLVYMGGDTHIPDLELVIPVLSEIMDRYAERVSLHIVGMHPHPALASLPGVKITPFIMDYAHYASFAMEQRYDLAIAPLIDNTFNRCKSSIKVLEYSALGLPAIYSNIPPYNCVITDLENGLLASTREEWTRSICRLIDEPDLRLRIGRLAQDNVRCNWRLADHAYAWAEAYEKIAASPKRRSYDLRTVPASLVIELIRQTQAWEESALLPTTESEIEAQEAGVVNNGSGDAFSHVEIPKTTIQNKLASALNRGMGWFSAQRNKKAS